MKYKAILIDWDDTIGDWKGAADKALRDLYAEYGLGHWYADEATFKTAYETYNKTLWEQYGWGKISKQYLKRQRFLHLLEAVGAEGDTIALADEMSETFLQLTNTYFRVLPHAAEVVRYLAARYPLTILSNGFKEVQYYKFAHSGLQDCFRHTIISEEVGINKPQPGIFELALRLNGVSKEEAIMVGDSYTSDIQGAQNAGIDQLWICPDDQVHDGEKATYRVPDIMSVQSIL